MNKLLDLRFMIGAFFTIVGAVLIGVGFLSTGQDRALASGFTGSTINLVAGGCMGAFGVFMVLISYLWPETEPKEAE